jgi:hypothetical protein
VSDPSAEKNNPETAKRRPRGKPFEPGVSGNANGRPAGSKNRSTLLFQGMVDEQGPALIKKAVQMALEGDSAVMRTLLALLLPPRKDRHVTFELPAVASAEDALNASRLVIAAVADGRLTPSEGAELAKALEVHIRLHTTVELEQGLATLEQQQGRVLAS